MDDKHLLWARISGLAGVASVVVAIGIFVAPRELANGPSASAPSTAQIDTRAIPGATGVIPTASGGQAVASPDQGVASFHALNDPLFRHDGPNTPTPDNNNKRFVSLRSTAPVLHECPAKGDEVTCFRILMQVGAKTEQTVRVAVPTERDTDELMGETTFSSSGALCKGYWRGGLPRTKPGVGAVHTWDTDDPTVLIGPDRRGSLAIEFMCDGSLTQADTIRMHVTLALSVNAGPIQFSGYDFEPMPLRVPL